MTDRSIIDLIVYFSHSSQHHTTWQKTHWGSSRFTAWPLEIDAPKALQNTRWTHICQSQYTQHKSQTIRNPTRSPPVHNHSVSRTIFTCNHSNLSVLFATIRPWQPLCFLISRWIQAKHHNSFWSAKHLQSPPKEKR